MQIALNDAAELVHLIRPNRDCILQPSFLQILGQELTELGLSPEDVEQSLNFVTRLAEGP